MNKKKCFTLLSAAVLCASQAYAEPQFSKGFIPIPNTNSAVKFGGFVKLAFNYDMNSAHGADFLNFTAIPLDGTGDQNQSSEFHFTAKQTRLNVTHLTKTSQGDVKLFAEGDFLESNGAENLVNRHGFGLRHAYGEFAGFRIGQDWTTMQDMTVFPDSLNLIGSAGGVFIRQVMARYTAKINKKNEWMVALENPVNDIDDTTGGNADTSTGQFPDIILGITHKDHWGHVSLRGVSRRLHVHDTATSRNESTTGWGATLSAKLKFVNGDELFGRYSYGDGMGRYIFEANNAAATYATDSLKKQTAHGGYIDYKHHWNRKWSSNLIYGQTLIDINESITGTAHNDDMSSAHVNLIWKPVEKVKFGLEYIKAKRKQASGVSGDLDRVLFAAFYNF